MLCHSPVWVKDRTKSEIYIVDLDVTAIAWLKAGYTLINNLRLKPEVINIELLGYSPIYTCEICPTPWQEGNRQNVKIFCILTRYRITHWIYGN